MPRLAHDQPILPLQIYSGLAASGTVSVAALSDRTRLEPSRIEAIISPWPGLLRDQRRDIVGFWELTAWPVRQARIADQRPVPLCLGLPVRTCAARSDGRGEFRLPANRRTHLADPLAKLCRTGPARPAARVRAPPP